MVSEQIEYLIEVDGESIPVSASMTLGNHLENDVVIAGEDVGDFHVRLEITERGPRLNPLGGLTVNIGGLETDEPCHIMLNEVFHVGQVSLRIQGRVLPGTAEADTWALVDAIDGAELPVQEDMVVGRDAACDVVLEDAHISRQHARLKQRLGIIWVQDLGSANGTRINGEAVNGAVRAFHGDEICFDTRAFQLLGRGGDLTPVAKFESPVRGTTLPIPEPTEPPASLPRRPAAIVGDAEYYLVEQGSDRAHPLSIGDTRIGSATDADIVLNDASVAAEHATINLHPEGLSITSHNSQTPVTVNHEEVRVGSIAPGDVVEIGDAVLLMVANEPQTPAQKKIPGWVGLTAAFVLAGLLGLLILL